ncbi:hypothetical protein HKX48_005090 [Thoreauomyces humboldtii]|nr:hypothetical protein HKX48_005090 [Thoreauomyces humboldtii]
MHVDLGRLALVSVLVAQAQAYGKIGHWLTGQIAQELLTDDAEAWTRVLLPEYGGSLARAALWADEVKPSWAKPHHYVNPPTDCSVLSDSPCNCITTSIANYTRQLSPEVQPLALRQEALKFVIHYVGDIHQPLHVSGRAKGGTEQRVVFGGRHVSLHEVWDYMMLEHRMKVLGKSRTDYAKHLLTTYPPPVTCPLPAGATIDSFVPACPMLWGEEASRLNCQLVWSNLTLGVDLAGTYYDAVIVEVERGVSNAGHRIAALLNAALKAVDPEEVDMVLKVQD